MINEKKYVNVISSPSERVQDTAEINNQDVIFTRNGTYTAIPPYTGFGTVMVNVSTLPANCIEKEVIDNVLTNGSRLIDLTGVTNIGDYVLSGQYYGSSISGDIVNNTLTTIRGINACYYTFCHSDITSVNFSALTQIHGSQACAGMFMCTPITSASFGALTLIRGDNSCEKMFYLCRSLTSINFSALTEIISSRACQNMFVACEGLTSVSFPALRVISGAFCCVNMFYGCSNLASLSFPALKSTSFGLQTTQFNIMLEAVTGCTVHFPSNLQSVIGSWTSVINGFGGTNTTVLFDLPATE